MSKGSEELSVGCPRGGLHTAGRKDGIILAPKFSGPQGCLLRGRESVKKKIASEELIYLENVVNFCFLLKIRIPEVLFTCQPAGGLHKFIRILEDRPVDL